MAATTFDRHVLRAWQLESGLTPEQVCVLGQVSYPYLRRIEDGYKASPSMALLTRLAAVYRRDVHELFTDDADRAGAR